MWEENSEVRFPWEKKSRAASFHFKEAWLTFQTQGKSPIFLRYSYKRHILFSLKKKKQEKKKRICSIWITLWYMKKQPQWLTQTTTFCIEWWVNPLIMGWRYHASNSSEVFWHFPLHWHLSSPTSGQLKDSVYSEIFCYMRNWGGFVRFFISLEYFILGLIPCFKINNDLQENTPIFKI